VTPTLEPTRSPSRKQTRQVEVIVEVMGDSRGRWEGDTLVVGVKYLTDNTWFDRAGNFHSADLHVVERFTLVTRRDVRRNGHQRSPQRTPVNA
jgi:hypothetical protein